jgi:hypothetical protein
MFLKGKSNTTNLRNFWKKTSKKALINDQGMSVSFSHLIAVNNDNQIEGDVFEVMKNECVLDFVTYKAGDYILIQPCHQFQWHVGKIETLMAVEEGLLVCYYVPAVELRETKCNSQWIKISKEVKEDKLYIIAGEEVGEKLTVYEWDNIFYYALGNIK